MIIIKEKKKCCGCKACGNICPKGCITFELDEEGFWYPQVDKSKCVDCGLCEKVCPLNGDFENKNSTTKMYAAKNKSIDVMQSSSSGGIFWPLVESTIREGGIVYGAALEKKLQVVHLRASTLEMARRFRKSKYLQSDINNTYVLAKKDLEAGRQVLFSGTGCQIAGLYSFLGFDYENLFTVEVVCHGVPSRTAFQKYITELNEKEKDVVDSIIWRDKRNGWNPPKMSIHFLSGKERVYDLSKDENIYQRGFLNNLYQRPACYSCPFASLPRIADITLADYWGYEGRLQNDFGVSILIISSDKGYKMLNSIRNDLEIEMADEEHIKRCSPYVSHHIDANLKRILFFADMEKYSFDDLYEKYIKRRKRSFLEKLEFYLRIKGLKIKNVKK